MSLLADNHGRKFYYLRLSVTDICNFRCSYCLPNGYVPSSKTFLNLTEIKHLLTAFSELGIQKVRLTGGEPTLRQDFIDIATTLTSIPGIQTRAFTTNGYRLKKFANAYYQAGLNAINVSVDSLDPKKFFNITQHDRLADVLAGIEYALAVGFSAVKINVVLLKGINDDELERFLAYIKDKPIAIRFIELMQTQCNHEYFLRHHLSAKIIQDQLTTLGWQEESRAIDAGPAIEFTHPDSVGRIGFIAPYAKDFCASCNRLRVSASGNLHLCLFGDANYSLRSLLQHAEQKEQLKQAILAYLPLKSASHFLQQGNFGNTPHLASIGG